MSENQAKPQHKKKSKGKYRGKKKPRSFDNKSGGKGPSNNGNKNNNNKKKKFFKKGPRLSAEELITLKYNNLLEQHLLARKKYFALFHRADPNQKAKLERIYYNTASKLREFEMTLTGEKKELFKKHFDSLKPDYQYSTNHDLPPEPEHVSHQEEFEDPHYLEMQKEAKYADDTEESMGSIEDYKKYKGLV
ncbi:hypothetical protein [Halobacteriovorax sp. HLS]|uniref:hypothetical protein n=1 Tax=Halobacteriovorax sp. HLS TaxID=2234000 RepID=UPI000FDBF759|nr:hypothetical protein [Halobacteriovorax sp. HLS]